MSMSRSIGLTAARKLWVVTQRVIRFNFESRIWQTVIDQKELSAEYSYKDQGLH